MFIGCLVILGIIILCNIGKKGTFDKYSIKIPSRLLKKPKKDSSGEIECKRVLEKLFNKPFNKIRPNYLRNPVTSTKASSHNLEIDCYNDELKLGVEYNGRQHYEYVPFFHRNKDAFYNQKYRDELKRIYCKENGIKLIEVPYTVKVPDIENYIIKQLPSNP
ncbi:hypothetical protein OAF54_03670 [bacterium]|nr:hypothetical protein [bacterium]